MTTSMRTKRRSGIAGLVLLVALSASCSDRTIIAPLGAPAQPSGISAPIGALSWLSPLGTGAANPATFDAAAVTQVDVCVWTAGACSGAPVAQFATAPTGGTGALVANTTVGRYEASWNLLNTALLTRKTYRIRALSGSIEVGSMLVDVVRGRWALTRADGTLAPLIAANALPIQFHVAVVPPPTVVINEVESNGGVPGDWVELYNTGQSPVDLSGFVFKDNNDTHIYTIPSGTTIAAGGYLVLEEADFGFGLGAPDAARLFTPWGTVLDSYTWSTHAATTYGRCPNATGGFVTTSSSTKGTTNDCSVAVKINEVESNGGTPGDWIELYNPSANPVDLSGFQLKDDNDAHIFTIPSGTTIAAGAFMAFDVEVSFGLGSADMARLFTPAGALVDSYAWTAHATTTYGRCPDGTGAFTTTTASTKGAANNCTTPNNVKINEVESSGGTPGDWIELTNTGTSAIDISGFVLKDDNDAHIFTIPAGTSIGAGAYLAFDVEANFGLGAPDAARLFDKSGALLDSYTWTTHAATTYGRCPNGTGTFVVTLSSTKGAANACAATGPVTEAWPGSDDAATVDGLNVFGGNLSGLIYEAGSGGAPDVLWGARNGPGSIFRLIFNGSIWTPDATNGWGAGKGLFYTNGTGEPDSEDLTFTTGSAAGMYVASERNNSNNSVSRPSILRYDVTGSGTTLTATNEWNLTADLPAVAANSGLEGITWVPDSALVAQGFLDVSAGHLYNPAEYPNHGGGLFFVGLEGNGVIYVYALNHVTNGFSRITSVSTGFPAGVMALQFDRELGQLWATCDDTCGGLSDIFVIDTAPGSPTLGRLKLTHIFARASTMPNINNEGFAFAPQSKCVAGLKPAFWSDDSETGGHAIRKASIPCVKFP
ncbi:MAG: lamin tail domain-containing protein [bacterium]